MLPTPAEIVAYLDRYLIGQPRAKLDLATAVYDHYLAAAWRQGQTRPDAADFGRQHALLMGPTGSGKTYLVRKLAELLDVPVAFCAATSLVAAGYRGQEIETIIEQLVSAAGGNAKKAEGGIVFLDEADKIRRRDTHGTRDISGEDVQNGLLTILDGRVLHRVNTARVLFIAAGAFGELADIVRRRLSAGREKHIGFGTLPPPGGTRDDTPGDELNVFQALSRAELVDLVGFGLIPEFVGRFAVVTALEEWTAAGLANVLRHSRQSIVERQRLLFSLHGIDLRFEDEALLALAEDALALGTGARALDRLVLRALDPVDSRLVELSGGGVTGIVFPDAASVPSSRRETPPAATPGEAGSTPERLKRLKNGALSWNVAPEPVRQWWQELEKKAVRRPEGLLLFAEELARRRATLAEAFLAAGQAQTDRLPAILHYLDYWRAKNTPPPDDEDNNGDRPSPQPRTTTPEESSDMPTDPALAEILRLARNEPWREKRQRPKR